MLEEKKYVLTTDCLQYSPVGYLDVGMSFLHLLEQDTIVLGAIADLSLSLLRLFKEKFCC